MAQNITLLGASYTDVPSVQLPKTGGGMASFDDTTDADATASDILTGKTAYVNGVKLTGTGSGGGSGAQYASGTYTTTTKYSSTGNRAITTIATIGFTPKYFLFYVDKLSDVSGTQYAVVNASANPSFGADDRAYKTVVRTSNTSGSINGYCANTSWTTQTNGYLYLSNGTIYFRTTSSYIIEKDVTYHWEAYG